MKKNMGGTDKIIRLLIAAVLVILYTSGILTGTLGWIALAFAGIFAITGFFSFCPLYTVLGITTNKKPAK